MNTQASVTKHFFFQKEPDPEEWFRWKFNWAQSQLGKYVLTHLFGNKVEWAQNNKAVTVVVILMTDSISKKLIIHLEPQI